MSEERIDLVGPCGIDCGHCELYTCRDDPALYGYLLTRGIPKEKLPCSGCRAMKGACPVISETCQTYSCSEQKNLDYCFECSNFPCNKLHPSADRADILPHNLKVFNLCVIKNRGIEEFIKSYPETKRKYYQGKMEIGMGPRLEE